MAYNNKQNILFIIDFFTKKGYAVNFICGLLGNIWTETAGTFSPNQVQLSYLNNKSYALRNCDDYVRMVNDGSWLDPSGRWFGEDRVGFGLCQWTSVGRKTKLYEYCKNKNMSIDNLQAQCEWIDTEIHSTGYANVRKAIAEKWTIEECARIICTDFERPAGKDDAAKQQVRIDHALQIYKDFYEEKESEPMGFELKTCMLTNNGAYKDAWKINPVGIIVHSTGANNPYLKRYVQPDDGILGTNAYKNDWNRAGVDKCVHAMIGRDQQGIVRCYQTLPFNYACWGIGRGKLGSYNYPATIAYPNDRPYIQFEICEDGLTDEKYFNEVMKVAQQFCAYLMKEYPAIHIENVISHHEGYLRKMGSGHADIDHWLKKFNKDMDWFRNGVLTCLNGDSSNVIAKDKENIVKEEKPVFMSAPVTYTIKRGDTLGAIAKRFDTTVTEIAKINPQIKNLSLIYIGQAINMPHRKHIDTYTVVAGDTLSKIGKNLGVDWKKIAAANNISAPLYIIRKGQTLVIPNI